MYIHLNKVPIVFGKKSPEQPSDDFSLSHISDQDDVIASYQREANHNRKIKQNIPKNHSRAFPLKSKRAVANFKMPYGAWLTRSMRTTNVQDEERILADLEITYLKGR